MPSLTLGATGFLDLDFAMDDDQLGKPAGADLSLGLATAPILFAAQDHPELRPLIERRFKGDGDVTMM